MTSSDIHILTNRYCHVDPWIKRPHVPLELDLGCGKGGFALQLAERFPERFIVGADVMIGRLRKAARRAARLNLTNIEFLRASNTELVGYQLPDACVARVHILCPDPWPKDRHRWRRLISSDFMTRVARVLQPGSVVHVATDDADYLRHMRHVIGKLRFYTEDEEQASLKDLAGLRTDFEQRWLAQGRHVPHLAYIFQRSALRQSRNRHLRESG